MAIQVAGFYHLVDCDAIKTNLMVICYYIGFYHLVDCDAIKT